jgi:hydratase-aldolase
MNFIKHFMVLSYDDFKGVFALLPACATTDAHKWSSVDTIAVEAQRNLVNRLIEDGVDGIITTGSTGECHTLLWEEQKKLFEIVVDEVNGRVPVLTGTWAPNTRESIVKTRYAIDVGADGIMNGPPQYVEPTVENTIQYYKDIAESCPDAAIMIYHNPNAFRVTIPVERFQELKEIPTVISMKESMADLNRMKKLAEIAGEKICFMTYEPFAMEAIQYGFGGIWSAHSICMGPEPVLKLYQSIRKRNWETAKAITDQCMDIYSRFFERMGGFQVFMKYQVNAMHECVNAAGYAETGPARPPFTHAPDYVIAACQAHAKDWRNLVEKCK